jgi:hypothetical protein
MRTSIPESAKWEQANEQRRQALARQRSGLMLAAGEQAVTQFTVADLFASSELRRRTIIAPSVIARDDDGVVGRLLLAATLRSHPCCQSKPASAAMVRLRGDGL